MICLSFRLCSVRHRSPAANDANQRAVKLQVRLHSRRYGDYRRKFEMYSDATARHLWRTGLGRLVCRQRAPGRDSQHSERAVSQSRNTLRAARRILSRAPTVVFRLARRHPLDRAYRDEPVRGGPVERALSTPVPAPAVRGHPGYPEVRVREPFPPGHLFRAWAAVAHAHGGQPTLTTPGSSRIVFKCLRSGRWPHCVASCLAVSRGGGRVPGRGTGRRCRRCRRACRGAAGFPG